MGATGKLSYQWASAILDAGETNQTEDKTGWLTTDQFIITIACSYADPCNKATDTAVIKLQYRRDAGTWTDVNTGNEMIPGTTTNLVNGSACSQHIAGDPTGGLCATGFAPSGKEVEGVLSSTTFTTAAQTWTEVSFAVNPVNAVAGGVYSFRLYNVTDNVALDSALGTGGACPSTLTMYAAAQWNLSSNAAVLTSTFGIDLHLILEILAAAGVNTDTNGIDLFTASSYNLTVAANSLSFTSTIDFLITDFLTANVASIAQTAGINLVTSTSKEFFVSASVITLINPIDVHISQHLLASSSVITASSDIDLMTGLTILASVAVTTSTTDADMLMSVALSSALLIATVTSIIHVSTSSATELTASCSSSVSTSDYTILFIVHFLHNSLIINGDAKDHTSVDSSVAPLYGWTNVGVHDSSNKVTIDISW